MMERIYFAAAPRSDELQALKQARPKHVLVSYALWKRKNLQRDLIDRIGYTPESVMLDSGAYTFHNLGIDTGIEDIIDMYGEESYGIAANQVLYDCYALDRYAGEEEEFALPVFNQFVEFVHANAKHISHVISLDTIGDSELSKAAYYILENIGLRPIPVFGYGDDWDTLDEYVGHGAAYIALGGSAHRTPTQRVQWANEAGDRHPDVRFHLLGTMNDTIIRATRQNVYSLDGTAWNATFKERRYEGRTKVEQSVANIRRKQALVEPIRLENGDWVYANANGQIALPL